MLTVFYRKRILFSSHYPCSLNLKDLLYFLILYHSSCCMLQSQYQLNLAAATIVRFFSLNSTLLLNTRPFQAFPIMSRTGLTYVWELFSYPRRNFCIRKHIVQPIRLIGRVFLQKVLHLRLALPHPY